MPFNREQWINNGGYMNPYGSYGIGQGVTQPSLIQAQPRRAATSMVPPSTPPPSMPQKATPYNSPFNNGQAAWQGGQWSGNGQPPSPAAAPAKPIDGTPLNYDWGGYTNPYSSYTQPGAYVPPTTQSAAQKPATSSGGGGAPAAASSSPASKSVYNDGFWDYDDQGYKLDSVGNRVYGTMGSGISMEELKKQFQVMQMMGQTNWTGSFNNWVKNGMPKAGQYTPEQMQELVSGRKDPWDFNYGQPAAPATPGVPAAPPATPGGALPPGQPGAPSAGQPYTYPFMNQALEWYGQPANQQAVQGWWNAYAPMMEFQQNQANNLNNWNMDVWTSGWGMVGDQFNMGMDQSQMMNDYNNNLNILASNDWSNQLQADVNAYGYGSQLYGNLYNSDANLAGNYLNALANQYNSNANLAGDYLNAQANQYGSYVNAGANLANTYANTGLGYDTLTNQYSIAQMQALNDWYNQQARNQADMQIATMQAFGRDQAPNTRFLSNWG